MYYTGYIAYVEGNQNAVFDGIICSIRQASNYLQWQSVGCIPLPRPSSPLLYSLIDTIQLNAPDFVHQCPCITP